MWLLDLRSYPAWVNLAIFVVGAALVYAAGTRLSRQADALAERMAWGRSVVGALLLGGFTSAPEGITTLTAALGGNAPLAANNLLGGIALQLVFLAWADAALGGRALTRQAEDGRGLQLQGALLIAVLLIVTVGIVAGPVALFGVGAWSLAASAVALGGLAWVSVRGAGAERAGRRSGERGRAGGGAAPPSLARVVAAIVMAGLLILLGGYLVVRSAEALSDQTGLGATLIGAILVALATSLPELSTTTEAVRLGSPALAISNIFGTNLFDAALLLVADLAYAGGPILGELVASSQVVSALGIVLTAVYLVGLQVRSERTLLGLGYDSALVVALYAGGVVVLYALR